MLCQQDLWRAAQRGALHKCLSQCGGSPKSLHNSTSPRTCLWRVPQRGALHKGGGAGVGRGRQSLCSHPCCVLSIDHPPPPPSGGELLAEELSTNQFWVNLSCGEILGFLRIGSNICGELLAEQLATNLVGLTLENSPQILLA